MMRLTLVGITLLNASVALATPVQCQLEFHDKDQSHGGSVVEFASMTNWRTDSPELEISWKDGEQDLLACPPALRFFLPDDAIGCSKMDVNKSDNIRLVRCDAFPTGKQLGRICGWANAGSYSFGDLVSFGRFVGLLECR